ncbi:MAG: hypothetical protein ACYSWR_04165, partial [Planctomycetota bacterium]
MFTKKEKQELHKIIRQELWDFFEKFYRFQAYYDTMVQQGKPRLSPIQRVVLGIIYQVPEGEGILGSEIMKQYKIITKLTLPPSTFYGSVIKKLKIHYNVDN